MRPACLPVLASTFALAALLAPRPAAACDCDTAEPDVATARATMATVVHGRVMAVVDGSDRVDLFVVEAWKGATAGTTVTLAVDRSSCGYRLVPGQDVLIYAPADAPVQQCAGPRTARVVFGAGIAADRAALGRAASTATAPATVAMATDLSATAVVDSVVDGDHLHAYVSVRKAGRGTRVGQRVALLSSDGACALAPTLAAGDIVRFTGAAMWAGTHAVVSPCLPGTSVTVIRKARPRRAR